MIGLLGFGLVGALIWIFLQRRRRLDKDRDQHHLASLLIAVAAGEEQATRAELDAFVAEKGWTGAQLSTRVSHAVRLAGSAVQGPLLDQVTTLARSLLGR